MVEWQTSFIEVLHHCFFFFFTFTFTVYFHTCNKTSATGLLLRLVRFKRCHAWVAFPSRVCMRMTHTGWGSAGLWENVWKRQRLPRLQASGHWADAARGKELKQASAAALAGRASACGPVAAGLCLFSAKAAQVLFKRTSLTAIIKLTPCPKRRRLEPLDERFAVGRVPRGRFSRNARPAVSNQPALKCCAVRWNYLLLASRSEIWTTARMRRFYTFYGIQPCKLT